MLIAEQALTLLVPTVGTRNKPGSVLGTAKFGVMLATGVGVPADHVTGVMYLGIAAGQGSDWAAFKLGAAMYDGKYGLSQDKPRAIYWLKKSLSKDCRHQHMTKLGRTRAEEKLAEVTATEC